MPASHETVDQRMHYVKQDGQTVFRVRGAQDRGDLPPPPGPERPRPAATSTSFVSHQANRRIIYERHGKLGVDPSRVVINIERYGNTTAGTIPLALSEALADGRLKKGNLVMLTSVGAGFYGRRSPPALGL